MDLIPYDYQRNRWVMRPPTGTKENNKQFDTESKTMLENSSIKKGDNNEENEHTGEEIKQKIDSSDKNDNSWPPDMRSFSSIGSSVDPIPWTRSDTKENNLLRIKGQPHEKSSME